MRIVLVTPTFFPSTYWGGPTTAMHSLCNAIAALPDLHLEVVTTDAAGISPSETVAVSSFPVRFDAGYDVFYCRRRFLVSVSPQLLLTAWRRMRQAEVVHLSATYSFPTLPVLAMARALSKPLVWTPHGAMIPWKETRKAFLKSFWNSACRVLLDPRRSVIHVASEREATSARTVMGAVPIKVIAFGIDIPHASRAERPRGHALHLLFVGRLDPIKGLDNLLKALTIESARSATLSICGTGDAGYAASLRKMAMTLGVASRVRFEGHVDDARKEAQFAAADALVLPSHTENFGLVIAEALAHGVPVIASKGTPWSAVESEGCGLWVDNSPESLARAISALHSMDLASMGAKGRRWVGGRFSWPAIAAEMAATYEGLRKSDTV